MKHALLLAAGAASLLASAAFAQPAALGLSHAQIEDADLVDAKGREIGEVERVVTDASGKVTGLIVEVDQRDPKPDRLVQIPLAGLKAVPEKHDPTDHNIQTDQTVEALLALPVATLN